MKRAALPGRWRVRSGSRSQGVNRAHGREKEEVRYEEGGVDLHV